MIVLMINSSFLILIVGRCCFNIILIKNHVNHQYFIVVVPVLPGYCVVLINVNCVYFVSHLTVLPYPGSTSIE